ncbi:MAG: serine hydrolase [Pseudomonadota bacterium]
MKKYWSLLAIALMIPGVAKAQTALPVANPTQSDIALDGDPSEWIGDAAVYTLIASSFDSDPVTLSLAYSPDGTKLYAALEMREPVAKTDIFIDAENDLVLDRPAQFVLRKTLSVVQAEHKDGARVETSSRPDAFVQEWLIDLAALGVSVPRDVPLVIGFDVELSDDDGLTHQFGAKGEKWLVDRRLERIALLPHDTELGTIAGRIAWQDSSDAPPDWAYLISEDGFYRQLLEVDRQSGRYAAIVPEGRYRISPFDTRTVFSLGDDHEFELAAGQMHRLPDLQARLPYDVDLDALLTEVMERDNVRALSFVYIDRGQTVAKRTKGIMSDGTPAGEDALFKMASVSKPIGAMVALTLVREGLWSLDEPLANHWRDPALGEDPRIEQLTTRMVLRHLSGLPNHASEAGLEFLHDPGTRQSYSGEGYTYLRRALEAKFDRPIQALAKEYLLDPAGMDSSWFQGPPSGLQNYTQKYHNEFRFDPPSWDEAPFKGGLLTTTDDLEAFLRYFIDQSSSFGDLWSDITRPNDASLLESASESYERFGLSWVANNDGTLTLSHGGSEYGARTYMVILPEEQTALVVANNATGGRPAIRALAEATLLKNRHLPAIDAAFEDGESFEW